VGSKINVQGDFVFDISVLLIDLWSSISVSGTASFNGLLVITLYSGDLPGITSFVAHPINYQTYNGLFASITTQLPQYWCNGIQANGILMSKNVTVTFTRLPSSEWVCNSSTGTTFKLGYYQVMLMCMIATIFCI